MRPRSVIAAILSIILICLGFGLLLGQRVSLIADEDISILDSPSIDPLQANKIATLKAGERASVSECRDLKHYIVPEVQLAYGRKGYVVKGKFRLEAGPFWQFDKGPLVYSCRALSAQ